MLLGFNMASSVMKMECVAFTVHLNGDSKEFRYIAVYDKKSFAKYFKDITVHTEHTEINKYL